MMRWRRRSVYHYVPADALNMDVMLKVWFLVMEAVLLMMGMSVTGGTCCFEFFSSYDVRWCESEVDVTFC